MPILLAETFLTVADRPLITICASALCTNKQILVSPEKASKCCFSRLEAAAYYCWRQRVAIDTLLLVTDLT